MGGDEVMTSSELRLDVVQRDSQVCACAHRRGAHNSYSQQTGEYLGLGLAECNFCSCPRFKRVKV
ncbi:hypothetical protein [Lentzea sp. E54]|uniref:hypothetical protein n=1 Tax=Lentzea xerophila TaxID=3435883 RepID=UPI003DA23762